MGKVEDAYQMIKDMPVKVNYVVRKMVFAACRVHGYINLANKAIHELCKLMPINEADVIAISNVYAEENKWDDVEHLRTKVLGCSVSKHVAHSQVDVR